jgi:hypothetical protein
MRPFRWRSGQHTPQISAKDSLEKEKRFRRERSAAAALLTKGTPFVQIKSNEGYVVIATTHTSINDRASSFEFQDPQEKCWRYQHRVTFWVIENSQRLGERLENAFILLAFLRDLVNHFQHDLT